MINKKSDSVSRIFLIGLDGATWNVIDPMLEKGKLPNFKKVIKTGIRSDLRSLEFTASPRVWTSIATGKSEHKHGILDFYNTQRDLKAKRIWDILSEKRNETATLFYWYLTWPPPKDLNGVIVPGFLARDSRTVPKELSFLKDIELTQKMKLQESDNSTGLAYYLKQALNAFKNGVKISTMLKALSFLVGRILKNFNELDSFLRLQLIKFHLHTNTFCHLIRTKPTDFSAIMLPQTDQLGHKFWSFMSPDEFEKRTDSKISPEDKKKYGKVIWNTYSEIDKFIGRILKYKKDDDLLIILSDHGFGMVNEKYASLKVKSKTFLEILNLKNAAHCVTIGSSYIIQIKNPDKQNEIDQIANILREISIVNNDQKLFNVKTNEKEIVLELRSLFLMNISDANQFLKEKVKIGDKVVDAEDIFINRSDITGIHEELGILIMNGKNINKNKKIAETHVLDIVPTLLYLKNLSVGKDMDGKVMGEAIEKDFLNKYPIEYIDTYETDDMPTSQVEEDQAMPKELENRLAGLGYI